jgi:hypothetical protein
MSATLATRKVLGGWTAQTARIRLLSACTAVAADPTLPTARARLADLVERMAPVDPALAEALGRMLADTTDQPRPATLPADLPSILLEQAS